VNPSYYDDLRVYILLATVLSIILVTGLIIYLLLSRMWPRDGTSQDPRFRGREPLTLDQFYERYYAEEGFPRNSVQEVLVSYAEAGGLPHALLRPEDSFTGLRVPESERTQEFAQQAARVMEESERRFGIRLLEFQVTTLDDYIRLYSLAQQLFSRHSHNAD
jgi:hypothetical protein